MNTLTNTYTLGSSSSPSVVPRQWVSALFAAFRKWREEVRLVGELSGMDDRELADFGLPRSEIVWLAKGRPVPACEGRTRWH